MLTSRFNPNNTFFDFAKVFDNYPHINEENSISAFMPKVNTIEDETAYHIMIDLPGVKKDDINIDLNENILTVYGSREYKQETKKEDYYKLESSFGKFQRAFSLPENIDSDNITASNDNGVLEIIVPKKQQVENKKKIEIK
ncbi:Hsp20/alpha crystallin family protein [Arcobacter sp. FWKO B]|uniref:Hsp20/alpha crystallin family protein n=1 Tax=Arcobacter sp. FWKO B TaxID=2593672 RepID=UPI0018A5B40E|nr:Hsp20/alpha crystallin family protein [Arcobacter sp. FWKO B]QOG12867.1 Hsp20/alpha crystallin family protein [Arcobacter sp. FWKO B]